MNPPYRITPRNLGSLELEDACLKDFFYKSKLRFQPPYNDFGAALFSDCQRIQEAMIGHYLEKDGCLPKSFSPFCDVTERVDVNKHWSKYGYMHKSGVWLYGSPDEVFYRKDGSVLIWDHKTAHPKADGVKDKFLPQYETQVTGYGLIAEEGLGLGTVSAGALGYWDIQHEAVIANPAKFIREGKLWVSFNPVVHAVEIDYSRIDKLLKEAIKIWDSKVPPEGRAGCANCKKLEAVFAIQEAIENDLAVRDSIAFSRSNNDPWVFRMLVGHLQDRRSTRLKALNELEEAGDALDFDDGSLVADWEFLN